jgi:hypothetical protein
MQVLYRTCDQRVMSFDAGCVPIVRPLMALDCLLHTVQ